MLRASARCSRDIATALRPVGGLDVEAHLDDAVLDPPAHLVPGVGEDREHLAVLGQHLGGEPAEALSCAVAARCSRRTEPIPLPW